MFKQSAHNFITYPLNLSVIGRGDLARADPLCASEDSDGRRIGFTGCSEKNGRQQYVLYVLQHICRLSSWQEPLMERHPQICPNCCIILQKAKHQAQVENFSCPETPGMNMEMSRTQRRRPGLLHSY